LPLSLCRRRKRNAARPLPEEASLDESTRAKATELAQERASVLYEDLSFDNPDALKVKPMWDDLLGRTIVFAGDGKDFLRDRCFVRDELEKWASANSTGDADDINSKRLFIKAVYVYAPSFGLRGKHEVLQFHLHSCFRSLMMWF